ncbi:ABC transporter substrate-binding protein [Streptomyces sp. NPDC002577]
MSKALLRPLAVLGLLALMATACGGGDGNEAENASGGKPIKIASIAAISGGVSSNPEYGDGAMAAVKSINAQGGINGRRLELTLCDYHQTATDSAACNRKILADKDIAAVVGGSDTYRDAAKSQIEAAKMPFVGVYPIAGFDLSSQLSFNVNGGIAVELHGLAQDVVASGAKKVGLVTLDIPVADVARKTVGEVMKAAGVEIVNNVQLSPSTADLSASAQQVTKGNPDAVLWLTFAAQTGVAVKALRETGYKGTVAFAASAFDRKKLEDMGADGPLTAGLVLPPAWDTSTAYGKQFNEDMKAYEPDGTIDELSLNSWLSVRGFAQLASTLDRVDRASVLGGIRKTAKVKTGGLTPAIDFSTRSPLPYAAVYNPAYTTVHVKNGEVTWDGKLHRYGTGKVVQAAP